MKLAWLVKRMSVMGAREILHRFVRYAKNQVEKYLLRSGWRPKKCAATNTSCCLFGVDVDEVTRKWSLDFALDLTKIDALVEGRIDVFSYEGIEFSYPINWLKDLIGGIETPKKYGKGINYRNRAIAGDIKLVWELARHQYLVPLAVAYVMTGSKKYRATLKNHIESWIESCPFGYTVHWCSSLEISLRIISWCIIHNLLLLKKEKQGLFGLISKEFQIQNVVYQHAWFIRHNLSLYSSANNHLIGELTGLWAVSNIFDLGKQGIKWSLFAKRRLEIEMQKQVYADGVDKEQAVYYHYWVLEYMLFSYIVGKSIGQKFSDTYIDRIKAMARFLSDLSPNGEQPPQIGDADNGFVARFSLNGVEDPVKDIVSVCQILFLNEKDKKLSEKAFWYSIIAGTNLNIQPTKESAIRKSYPKVYPEGGYAVLGDATIHIVFDAGALGYTSIAAHGHADALSICLAVDGQWWLIDPGTYTYHDNADWRNYFRGTAAHNTVLVDGLNQSKIGGDFLWLAHAKAKLLDYGADSEKQWASGVHDGYNGVDVEHQRAIEYRESGRTLRVCDTFSGSSVHEFCWHWHLHPKISSHWDPAHGAWVLRHSDSNKMLLVSGGDKGNWVLHKGNTQLKMGWYSEKLGHKEPSETLRYCTTERIPYRSVFSITLLEKSLLENSKLEKSGKST